jgi:hypothetical protein
MIEDRKRKDENDAPSEGAPPQQGPDDRMDRHKEEDTRRDGGDEQRYQKRAHDPSPDGTGDDERRYMSRLKPTDYKPGTYLWGYKQWSSDDEENEQDQLEGPTAVQDERSLLKTEDRDHDPLSTGKGVHESGEDPAPEEMER